MNRTAVLDIGGTSIKSGLVADGLLTHFLETPTEAKRGGAFVMERAAQILEGLPAFDRIGISTAGQVEVGEGRIRFANENIPGYTGMPVKALMEQRFQVPCLVDNDVNAAALGEGAAGAAKGISDYLCLTFGTGIGGAIVLGGRIFYGSSCSAGEVGHMVTHAGGRPCGCGQRGCYEQYASTTALVRAASAFCPEITDGRTLFDHLDVPGVAGALENWMEEILAGLATLTHIFNPGLIVLGGGILREERISSYLQAHFPQRIMESYRGVRLVPAMLGNKAGLYGAAALFERE